MSKAKKNTLLVSILLVAVLCMATVFASIGFSASDVALATSKCAGSTDDYAHNYNTQDAIWEWSSDYKTAGVHVYCTECGVDKFFAAEVSEGTVVKEPTVISEGQITYNAHVNIKGVNLDDTAIYYIPKLESTKSVKAFTVDSDIQIVTNKGYLPNQNVVAYELSQTDINSLKHIIKNYYSEYDVDVFAVEKLDLVDENGESIKNTNENEYTVTVVIPSNYSERSFYKVLGQDKRGNLFSYNATIDGNIITFTTSELDTFAIVTEHISAHSGVHVLMLAWLLVLLIGSIVVILVKKTNRNKLIIGILYAVITISVAVIFTIFASCNICYGLLAMIWALTLIALILYLVNNKRKVENPKEYKDESATDFIYKENKGVVLSQQVFVVENPKTIEEEPEVEFIATEVEPEIVSEGIDEEIVEEVASDDIK